MHVRNIARPSVVRGELEWLEWMAARVGMVGLACMVAATIWEVATR